MRSIRILLVGQCVFGGPEGPVLFCAILGKAGSVIGMHSGGRSLGFSDPCAEMVGDSIREVRGCGGTSSDVTIRSSSRCSSPHSTMAKCLAVPRGEYRDQREFCIAGFDAACGTRIR